MMTLLSIRIPTLLISISTITVVIMLLLLLLLLLLLMMNDITVARRAIVSLPCTIHVMNSSSD